MESYIIQNRDGLRVFLVAGRDEAEDFTVETATRYGTRATLAERNGNPLLIAEADGVGARARVTRP